MPGLAHLHFDGIFQQLDGSKPAATDWAKVNTTFGAIGHGFGNGLPQSLDKHAFGLHRHLAWPRPPARIQTN